MTPTAGSDSAAKTVYTRRRDQFAAERDALTRRWNRVANLRLVLFLLASAAAIWWWRERAAWMLVVAVALLALFVAAVVVHRRLGHARQWASILVDLNTEGLARLEHDWDALPLPPHHIPDPTHPYEIDLDLFGRASLAHLIQTTATPMGAATLTNWLRQPADPGAIPSRQAAAADLAPELAWRQELAARGRLIGTPWPDFEPVLDWAESRPLLVAHPWLPWLARVTTALTLGGMVADATGLLGPPFWLAPAAINLVLSRTVGAGATGIVSLLGREQRGINLLAALVARAESVPGDAPILMRTRDAFHEGNEPASHALKRLGRIAGRAIPVGSILWLPLQAVALWDVQVLASVEGWQARHGTDPRAWLQMISELEALSSLAGLHHDRPDWAVPELDSATDHIQAHGLAHPLLPDAAAVANDVVLGPPGSVLLVTGSNMSGKSTLLRAIGLNVVLANAGAPVRATSMRLPPLLPWTSGRIEDSLERGVSFYFAELQRLKQVVDAADRQRDGGHRVLYLLDEILHGTNTTERQIAARQIIRHLVKTGAIGAVSTHDLSLAEGPELGDIVREVHLRETVTEGPSGPDMTFDYRVRSGPAPSTNALILLELVFGPDFIASSSSR